MRSFIAYPVHRGIVIDSFGMVKHRRIEILLRVDIREPADRVVTPFGQVAFTVLRIQLGVQEDRFTDTDRERCDLAEDLFRIHPGSR